MGKERGDLDLLLYQSNPPLCEGIILDLGLGVNFGVHTPFCSSSLIPPIVFVALLEFGSEGLGHLSGVLAIALGASVWVLYGDLVS